MKLIQKIILLFITITFFNCSEEGLIGLVEYGDITGKVVTKEGFTPIPNAKITLSPSSNSTFTDAEGNFKFTKIETREYSVKAIKEGFLSDFQGITVSKNTAANVVIELDISTALNKPPTKPALTSPKDNAVNLDNVVSLSWTATDPDKDDLTYKIEVRNDQNSDIIRIENYKKVEYKLKDLKYGAKYFWQIGVSDGINPMVYSETRSFSIKEFPENRFFYVKNENNNTVIYSSGYNASEGVTNLFRLTPVNTNSWRPRKNNTANLIAFFSTSNNQTHIFTIKPNGEDMRKVTSTIPVTGFNLNEIDFSWSADGSKFIYPHFDKLYMINKDGTGLQMIHKTTDGSLITECDWSEDGTKIAIKTNNSNGYNAKITIIDTTGNILAIPLSGISGAVGGLNLSASGNKLLYTRDVSGFESPSYRQLNSKLFVYDFQTGIATDISGAYKPSGTNDLDPRFSPNESEIIFVNTSNDGISEKNIYKTNLNTNEIERVKLFSKATMPDWE